MSDGIISISDIVGPGRGIGETSVTEPLKLTLPVDSLILKDTPVRITTDGKFAECSVDTFENSSVVGVAIADSSSELTAIVTGIVAVDYDMSAFSNGDSVFLSPSGTMTHISPSITGQFITRIGTYYTNNQVKILPETPVEVMA